MSGFGSTQRGVKAVGFKEAVLTNVPNNGGLFVPKELPSLTEEDLNRILSADFPTTAQIILGKFMSGEILSEELGEICNAAFTFDIPLKILSPSLGVLELFYGPTQAFKDVGVRFMAEFLSRLDIKKPLTILTATSGDTGAAVANAFYNKPNVKVVVLYPRGKISQVQEVQISSLGGNVHAFAIDGSFDDCQRMVNEIFTNKDLVALFSLTSANSINLARLLPQISYYAYAWAQVSRISKLPILVSVPSGNFGNIYAGLIAQRMGIPIGFLVAATNINSIVPAYLTSGKYRIQSVEKTITTAMDIVAPNNFPRIESLVGPGAINISKSLYSLSITDDETKEGMRELLSKYQYVSDPHGALGYIASSKVLPKRDLFRIFLETAHPSKFPETIKDVLNIDLASSLGQKIKREEIEANTGELIKILNSI